MYIEINKKVLFLKFNGKKIDKIEERKKVVIIYEENINICFFWSLGDFFVIIEDDRVRYI